MAEKLSSPNPEEQQPQEPTGEQPPKEERQSSITPEQILEMSPKEMADLFMDLDSKGELQSFLEGSAENPSLVAQFSYWEKWLQKDQRRLVDETVAKKREAYEGGEDKESLPLHLEKRFTPEELSLIFSATGAIQLCFGCSKSCPFCAFDAVPGTREHIPYSQLANLFQEYGQSLATREPILYWASEPSDYASKMGLEDKTYQDVHQLAVQCAGYTPHVTSRESSDEDWIEFLKTKTKYPRVSAYGYPEDKFHEILEKAEGEITVERGFGSGGQHIKGIGVSSLNFNQETVNGIGCIDGVLLTPRGLYNVVRLPISKEFPQGQIVTPLESVSEEEIQPGDRLQDILRSAVVVDEAESPDWFSSDRKEPFVRDIKIRTKNKMYHVLYDGNGVIEDIQELDVAEEEGKKVKKIEEKRVEEQKNEENREKYKERIQELTDRKKRWMKHIADWRREKEQREKENKDKSWEYSSYFIGEEIDQTKKEFEGAIRRSADRGVVGEKTESVDFEGKPFSWRKWLIEEWDGYYEGDNSFLADTILRSRNDERIVNMGVCGLDVAYDKWTQEVTLTKRKRPD